MEVSPLIASLLQKRGIIDAEAFLNPKYEAHTHDPMRLPGMTLALERLFIALERGERIAVYADYDCDGIGGAVVLSDFLRKIGHQNFEVYLPHRDREGYGFHATAVEAFAERGATLIITTDVGISGHEAVEKARSLDVDVIITDHHEAMAGIPQAVAVVDPKIPSTNSGQAAPYPFPHLCGAAVAWKFVQAALREGKRRTLPQFLAIPEGWEKWLLDVVAIATISDMVPLVGENRALLHFGLAVLRKSPRPGLRALCDVARVEMRFLAEDDVGFSIAPRLNAASRMDEPRLGFDLLTTHDVGEAFSIANHLETLNRERKGVVAHIVKEAKKRARERFAPEEMVAVLGEAAWKPSLLGLAANSLMRERGGVVCLWGRDAAGNLKGSCRSDGALSLVDLFGSVGDALEQYGGHAHSGGFTVSHEKVHTLAGALTRAAEGVTRASLSAESSHDADLPLSTISAALLQDISRLAPFGIGNPKPIFRVRGATIADVKRFGKERNHVEVSLSCAETGNTVRAFDFFKSPEQFSLPPRAGALADVLATLERDTYRGPSALALRIVDLLPAVPR